MTVIKLQNVASLVVSRRPATYSYCTKVIKVDGMTRLIAEAAMLNTLHKTGETLQ